MCRPTARLSILQNGSDFMSRNIRGFPLSDGVILGFVLAVSLVCLSGCGSGDPFSYVKVSGKVSYDDGSLIPAERVKVIFVSQSPPLDPKTYPPYGIAEVDPKTGSFKVVTSHNYGDGLVRGEHKVLIEALNAEKLRSDLVPKEYGKPETTPLMVKTDQSPFDLKVRKPAGVKAK